MNERHVSPEIAHRIEHAWNTILSSLREHKIYEQVSVGSKMVQTIIRDLAVKNINDATTMRRTKKEVVLYQETCTKYFEAQFEELVDDFNKYYQYNATSNLLLAKDYPPVNAPDINNPLNYASAIVKQNRQYYADALAVIRLTRELLGCPSHKNEAPAHPLFNMFNLLDETCITLKDKATRQWLELVIVKSDPIELQVVREQIVKESMGTERKVESYVRSTTPWVGSYNQTKVLCASIKTIMEQPVPVADASIDLGLGL